MQDVVFTAILPQKEDVLMTTPEGHRIPDRRFLGRRVSSEMMQGIEHVIELAYVRCLKQTKHWYGELVRNPGNLVHISQLEIYLDFSKVS